ncbi:hypothetical protein Barb4_00775 [Bacteroidales bacterium Barb4]|nr:hypothetical protein Barb4_00775 [Bacteroidales bacterium Barb4]
MEFNGLKYQVSDNRLTQTYIEVDKELPETVVKFYPNSAYSQEALMNNYLYLTYVSQFNDTFEASEYFFDFRLLDKNKYSELYNKYFTKIPRSEFPSYEEDKKNNFNMLRAFCKSFLAWVGSVSFTTYSNILNSLMWSHYASDKGWAIELDRCGLIASINQNDFGKWFFPINYVENLKLFNLTDVQYGEICGALLYMISTKNNEWKYEDEWRLTCYLLHERFIVPETLMIQEFSGKERKLSYPPNIIKKIILGQTFFNQHNVDTTFYRQSKKPLYKIKETSETDFINYIYENYNNILFMNGAFQTNDNIVRAIQQIELEKVDSDTFTFRFVGDVISKIV